MTTDAAERAQAALATQKVSLTTGLSVWKGTVSEEYLTELKPWSRAAKVFKEMREDVVIGALLESIKTPLLAAPFEVHPASQSKEDMLAAEFLEKNLFQLPDMEWREHVEEMLDFIEFGFAISEKVLEKRSDGKLWFRALIPVGQETLYTWGDPDKYGRVTGFNQRDPVTGKVNTAEIEKLLHFTWKSRKRNPHGHSMLHSLYRPWYFKKNLEAIEAIGAERDVGNAPVAELGEGHYTDKQIVDLQKALEGFRIDEALYVILPHGIKLQAFGGGGKVYNVRNMIRDWQHLIRQRFFADFLSLGSEQVGTQALAREMTSFFSFALRSVQIRMLEVWNRQLVPWLFAWNRWELQTLPKVAWSIPGRHSLQALAQAYNTFVGAGLLTPDESIEPQIREELGLPPLSPEVAELRRKALRVQLEKQATPEAPEEKPPGKEAPGGAPGAPEEVAAGEFVELSFLGKRGKGGRERFYEILDAAGSELGVLMLTLKDQGKKLFINWVRGEVGPAGMLSLRRQLREEFPKATTIEGFRITGAKKGSKVTSRLEKALDDAQ